MKFLQNKDIMETIDLKAENTNKICLLQALKIIKNRP